MEDIISKATTVKVSISQQAASDIADEAVRKARDLGLAITVCIVDESGNMKHFIRMDNAPLISVETSRKKAALAVGFGIPTGSAWYDFIKDDPILMNGAQQLPGFILLGGGLPIYVDGSLCGAIGVSGGHYSQDELCAKEALKVIS